MKWAEVLACAWTAAAGAELPGGGARDLGRYIEARQQAQAAFDSAAPGSEQRQIAELALAAIEVERGDFAHGRARLERLSAARLAEPIARDARRWLAKCLYWQGDYNRARAAFATLIPSARDPGRPGSADILRQAGRLERSRLNWGVSRRLLTEAQKAGEVSGDDYAALRARLELAVQLNLEGQDRDATAEMLAVAEAARGRKIARAEVNALEEAASLAARRGEYPTARNLAERALSAARTAGMPAAESRLLVQMASIVRITSTLREALPLLDQASAAAQRAGDVTAESTSLRQKGSIEFQRGQLKDAAEHYRAAVVRQKEAGQIAEAAESEYDLTNCLRSGDQKVLEAAERLAEVRRELGQEHAAAWADNSVGWRLLELNRYADALALARRSYTYFSSHRDVYCAAANDTLLAQAVRVVEGPARAVSYLERAERHFRAIGNESWLASTMNRRANVLRDAGDFRVAEETYAQAQEIYQKLGEVQNRAVLLNNVANLYSDRTQYVQAIQRYNDAIAIREKLGERAGLLQALSNLADELRRNHDYTEAKRQYERLESIAREIGDVDYQAEGLVGLGNVADDERDRGEAMRRYQAALEIRKRQAKPAEIASIMRRIGYLEREKHNFAEALGWFDGARPECRGIKVCEAAAIEGKGDVYWTWGRYEETAVAYQAALAMLNELESPAARSRLANLLVRTYYRQGKYPQAITLMEEDLRLVRKQGEPVRLASRLLDAAKVMRVRGEYGRARAWAKEALNIRERLGTQAQIAAALDEAGNIEQEASNPQAALKYFRRELEYDKRTGNQAALADTYNQIGDALSDLEDSKKYDEALENHGKALEIYHRLTLPDSEAATRRFIGMTYRLMDRYPEAINELETALRISTTRDTAITIYQELAKVQQDALKFSPALRSYQRMIDLSVEAGDLSSQSKAYNGRASLYKSLRQWNQAIADLKKDLELSRKSGDISGEAVTLNDLADVQREAGQLGDALENEDRALDIVQRKAADPGQAARYLQSKGAILLAAKKPDAALQAIEQGMRIAKARGDEPVLMLLLEQQGELFRDYPEKGDANAIYERALKMAELRGNGNKAADLSKALGTVALRTNDFRTAERWYKRYRKWAEKNEDADETATAEFLIGRAAERAGRKKEALEQYLLAMKIREGIRTTAEHEDIQISLGRDLAEPGRAAFDLLVEAGDYRRAFEVAERVRARALLAQLDGVALDYSGMSARDMNEFSALREKVASAEKRLGELAGNQGEREAEQALSVLTSQYEALIRRVAPQGRTEPRIAMPVPISILQARVPRNATLLVYFLANRNAVVFRVDRRTFSSYILAHKPGAIRDAVEKLLGWGTESGERLKGLETMLLGPVRSSLHGKLLGIVPHDVLHLIPFSALSNGKQYLSERFALFELPSASLLGLERRGEAGPAALVALAQPSSEGERYLAEASDEVRQIARQFRHGLFVADAARKDLLDRGANATLLHIAAHAYADAANPWNSTVRLREPVSIADLKEFKAHRLEMVVLSACETKKGKPGAADEEVSLQRAFLVAGARSVVASLWSVDDRATKLLMTRFYRHLTRESRAEALAHAQADVRRDYPNPLAWAGFVLSGDPGPVQLPERSGSLAPWFATAGITALLAALVTIRVRKSSKSKRRSAGAGS